MKKRMKEEGIEKGNLDPVDNRGCVGQVASPAIFFLFFLTVVQWYVRLPRLTLVCEVIIYRFQVRQNLKIDFIWGGGGGEPVITFLYLFLFYRFLRLTAFPSPKQERQQKTSNDSKQSIQTFRQLCYWCTSRGFAAWIELFYPSFSCSMCAVSGETGSVDQRKPAQTARTCGACPERGVCFRACVKMKRECHGRCGTRPSTSGLEKTWLKVAVCSSSKSAAINSRDMNRLHSRMARMTTSHNCKEAM